MITKEKKYISPEEYLKLERGSETKHEYFNGEIFAMSGASINHNMITVNSVNNADTVVSSLTPEQVDELLPTSPVIVKNDYQDSDNNTNIAMIDDNELQKKIAEEYS